MAQDATSEFARPLEGKVAVLTGARNNLARAFAVDFARMGADIVVHYHRADTVDQAEETARLCREAGAERTALAVGDLSQVENVRAMFDVAENELGGVDILVNNAGQIVKKPIADTTDEEYDRVFGINARGAFYCMREGANRMRDDGRIINIVSSLSPSLAGNYGIYAASKAAMEQFTRTLSKEVGGPDRRITVNSVHPGAIDNPFFYEAEREFHGENAPAVVEYVAGLSNAGRLGRESDIVPVVSFLATPAAQWMTGETLYANGGYAEH